MTKKRPALFPRLLAAVVLCLLLTASWSGANEESDAREQLEQLKRGMSALGEELRSDREQRGSLQAALRRSEIAIGQTQTNIKRTQKELSTTQSELITMRARRQELLVAKGQQQASITRELQTAYQMGRQSQMKILLNQEQPDTLARSMAYYAYFYDARKSHIERYLEILAQINTLEPEIAAAAARLKATQATLNQQRQELEQGKRERQTHLASLNNSIASKDQRLKQMLVDRQELERLLEAIEIAVANMATPESYEEFVELKGAMPWPIDGKPSNRYGGTRNNALRWQGLSIPAIEGTTVSAVHHGRVVFADWFRGSGLLLIIDHGDGYMSLYAHNQALLREVGEWVIAGAPVSAVGNSGGQNQAALYFEIRENGKPTDPRKWLNSG